MPGAERIIVYGPGGVGKSTLCSHLPDPVFVDVESGTRRLAITRAKGADTWDFQNLRDALLALRTSPRKTIVIDSATRVEELAVAHTLKTVKNDKGQAVSSIEGYGFGKGYQHLFETAMLFFSDLDALVRMGKNVALITHERVVEAPNPFGENFLRYAPALSAPQSGKWSIRDRAVQWADYVFFIAYDVAADDRKGIGAGTRTIYAQERPSHIAKARKAIEPVPWNDPKTATIWKEIFTS